MMHRPGRYSARDVRCSPNRTPISNRASRWASALAVMLVSATGITVSGTTAGAEVEAACTALTDIDLRDVRITAATPIRPDPVWQVGSAASSMSAKVHDPFCRVQGVIEHEIVFELWLPPEAVWNGRYLGAGNGGDAGFINYNELSRGLGRGFASASTDTGHTRREPDWALHRPDRLENFGHRAHHLLARMAKDIIELHYGSEPAYSYFSGCSGGGLQGMNLVQRYPGDYDGILSGASGRSMVGISARWLLSGLLAEQAPEGHVTGAEWQRVAETAVRQCDDLDGVSDGIIEDPRSCDFNPASVEGLTDPQVERVRLLMAPLTNDDGEQLFEGFEPGIAFSPYDTPDGVPARSFGQWTYQDPDWNPRQFDVGRDIAANEAAVPGLRAANPDLHAFRRVGGKLITYIGWQDAIVPAKENIAYYESVQQHMGTENTDEFFRLFMASGLGHCRGGPGAVEFGQPYAGDAPIIDPEHDLLSAIMRWVEQGVPPDHIIASRVTDGGNVDMTRKLCPYPQIARYDGEGDDSLASSFRCEAP